MIRTIFRCVLGFVLAFILLVPETHAAHIVGGDVSYTFLSFDDDTSHVTYRINVTMYRDNLGGGALFDNANVAFFGIFEETSSGNWELSTMLNGVSPTAPDTIIANDDPCVDEPIGQVGVEEASYIFTITLEISENDYMVSYQRCCRNETISNLINPGETGAVFDVIITSEAQKLGNSSPVFSNYPPLFICSGFPIFVDQSATDQDGDELVYSFCIPFSAGGTFDSTSQQGGTLGCCDCVRPSPDRCAPPFATVRFRPPFTPIQPLAGNPIVTIDSDNGLITGTPESTGQFVVGVCVEEFRNGVSIGKVRRDFQFNVLTCEKEVNAIIKADDVLNDEDNTFVINSCGDSSITIKNLSTDVSFIQSYLWEFYRDGNLVTTRSSQDASVTFPELGKYEGMMILNKGINCADTASFEVNMYPGLGSDYDFSYDTCVAGPVSFRDSSYTDAERLTAWRWEFGDNETSTETNPEHIYQTPGLKTVTLVIEDNNECMDTTIRQISYQPAPAVIVVEPTNFIGCVPSLITLNNLSVPIDSTYDIQWDLGDGTTSDQISPSHVYEEAGNYSISVDIVSPIGCGISRSYDSWIRIKDAPEADFDCFPEELTALNKTASFTDQTDIAGAWLWDFGGSGTSFDQNPTYTFPDTGIYKIILTAYHPVTNCPDTISKIIDVKPNVLFHFPNAFTPNNDSSNDQFLGNGYYEGLADFSMSIWNRWGQMVFETDDPREGWNGQEFNKGSQSPQGVYVYKAKYSDPRGKNFLQEGHITLLR